MRTHAKPHGTNPNRAPSCSPTDTNNTTTTSKHLKTGVCGKTAPVANLQDLMTFQLKGVGAWLRHAHARGVATPEADSHVKAAVFSVLTNVNFDPERMRDYILRGDALLADAKARLAAAGYSDGPVPEPLPWCVRALWTLFVLAVPCVLGCLVAWLFPCCCLRVLHRQDVCLDLTNPTT